MKPKLSKETAYKSLQDFFIENPKPMVIFGTGTSCSLDPVFGMQALKECLLDQVHAFESIAQHEWEKVKDALNSGVDLENAMNAVSSDFLIKEIVKITANFIGAKNSLFSIPLLSGDKIWPAQTLFKRIIDHLPETDKCLHVATTNYDLLAEYSFTYAGIPYITGFSGGILRKSNWERAERVVIHNKKIVEKNKLHLRRTTEKYIRLYKMHGSLNVFDFNGDFVENDEWIKSIPDSGNITRIMVTPGISKISEINNRRQYLTTKFDDSFKRHNAFLFLGFGFNDKHIINIPLEQKFTNHGSYGIIITKESNERIDTLLDKSENLWLVCEDSSSGGTSISNSRYGEKCLLPDRKIWMFENFTTEIFGV